MIKELTKTISQLLDTPNDKNEDANYYYVLNCLITAAKNQHAAKEKTGHRHQTAIKDFACYLHMLSGRLCYETLYVNLPIPSPTTISRYLHDKGPHVMEGVMRCSQLKKYWMEQGLLADCNMILALIKSLACCFHLTRMECRLQNFFLSTSAKTMNEHVTNNKVASTVSFSLFLIM